MPLKDTFISRIKLHHSVHKKCILELKQKHLFWLHFYEAMKKPFCDVDLRIFFALIDVGGLFHDEN